MMANGLLGGLDPQAAMLMGLASGLLGPRSREGFGAALGDGMTQGFNAYAGALSAADKRKMDEENLAIRRQEALMREQEAAMRKAQFDAQMADAARKQARDEEMGAAFSSNFDPGARGGEIADYTGEFQTAPRAPSFNAQGFAEKLGSFGGEHSMKALELLQSLQPKPQRPQVVGEGGALVDDTGRQLFLNPKPEKPPEQTQLARLLAERSMLPPDSPLRAVYDQQIAKMTTHAPAASQTVYTGTMVKAETPDGQSVFVMPDKSGGASVIPGVVPEGTRKAADTTAARKGAVESRAAIVLGKIDDAMNKVGFFTTGLTGAALGGVAGTKAYDLREDVKTVVANIGFQELQQMREMSPTGGALGQVAVQELNMLQAVLSSLNPNQSEEQLRDGLLRVKKHYQGWLGTLAGAKTGAGASGAPAGRTVTRTGTYQGRKVKQYSDGSVEYAD